MKTLLHKPQESFLPHLLWKEAGAVEKSILSIGEAMEELSLETGKELGEAMISIEDERLADEKLAALNTEKAYFEASGNDQVETDEAVRSALLSAVGAKDNKEGREKARPLAEFLGFRTGFMEKEVVGMKNENLTKDDLNEKVIEGQINILEQEIPENQGAVDPEKAAYEEVKKGIADEINSLDDNPEGENVPQKNQEEPVIMISKEQIAEAEKSVGDMIVKTNTLITDVRALYDVETDSTKKDITLKNITQFENSLKGVKTLNDSYEAGTMTKAELIDFGDAATEISAKVDTLKAEDFAKEDFSDPLPEFITRFSDIAARLDKQSSKAATSMERLINGLPNIREVFADKDVLKVQEAYKDSVSKEMNDWAKERRRNVVKNPKKADKKTSEMSPFLESFFTNMPNGAYLKVKLMELTDNPPGGLEALDYFDELGFGENVDKFFEEKAEQITALMEDPDYKVIDDSDPEDAKFLYEAALEAKAEGATKNMRELYILHLKKNSYMTFQVWMQQPSQKKKFGWMAKLSMGFNKFMDGFGDILKMFGFGANLSFNGLTDYETGLKNTSEGNGKEKEGEFALDDGLSDEYKKRDVGVNLENFASLSEAEKTDLWTKSQAETDPAQKKIFIEKYWNQYAANTEGAQDMVKNLETAKSSFGNTVDFLDLSKVDSVCSPAEFTDFKEKSESTPYKEFLAFGESNSDGVPKVSFDLWQEIAASFESFSPALMVETGTEKLTFTAEGSPEKVDFFKEGLTKEKIRDLVNNRLPKLQKEEELDTSKGKPQESKGFLSKAGSFIKNNPKTTATATGAAIGLIGGPVGAAIGAGVGFVAGAVYDWWTGGSKKPAQPSQAQKEQYYSQNDVAVTDQIAEKSQES